MVMVLHGQVLARTDGRFTYGLDDPYIHLAVAKNLTLYGAWGINAGEFSSCSSSIGWPFLLWAAFSLVGLHDGVPFWLNVFFASAAVVLVGVSLTGPLTRWMRLAWMVFLVAFIAFVPLETLPFSGMEHGLHLVVTLALAVAASRVLAHQGSAEDAPKAWWLLVLAPLSTLARYEGMFVILPIAAMLVWRGRWRLAFAMVGLAVLPIATFGLYALAQGGFFLPNSVLLKGQSPVGGSLSSYLAKVWARVNAAPHLVRLCLAGAGAFVVGVFVRPTLSPGQWLIAIALPAIGLHLAFAQTGFLFRYEAYLVGLGLLAVGLRAMELWQACASAGRRTWRDWWPVLGAAACVASVVLPFGWRGAYAWTLTPIASQGIYQQQVQMARFFNRHYAGRTVAVNDIGAVSFFGADRSNWVDLWGLATQEVTWAVREKQYGVGFIDSICRREKVEVAVLYNHYFQAMIPTGWEAVGTWTIQEWATNGSQQVTFYAVKPEAKADLVANLRRFSADLPPAVIQEGTYMAGLATP
ncbi:hypothetical protein D3C72_558210 [compost metagenome]